ncbi:MAG: hypothetical protein PHV12_00295 [Bacteroidales bacterium]|jgi:hypothetical protein|nr:hypothetical protein [Bacteroidales bacterium]MDD3272741.1 hypothetical protein [Bacteroidales bacterium]MDD4058130.1 hypothetical protein [Bacteroidales bacterium]
MRIIGIIQLTLLLPLLLLFSPEVSAQEIFGKAKYNYRSFAEKRLMVVVNQADFTDLSIADAVKSNWKISLYELCSLDKFQDIKADTNYFFMIRVDGQLRREKEANLEFLTIVKGGASAKKGIGSMDEIVSMPLQPINDESGKAFIFMPALISIMQEHILNVGDDILKAYVGNSFYSNRVDGIGKKELIFDESDIGFSFNEEELKDLFVGRILIGNSRDIAEAMIEAKENCVVSFTVSPLGGSIRGFSYKLLIDAHSHELLFYRRHKISKKYLPGFTQEDMRRISVPFRIK